MIVVFLLASPSFVAGDAVMFEDGKHQTTTGRTKIQWQDSELFCSCICCIMVLGLTYLIFDNQYNTAIVCSNRSSTKTRSGICESQLFKQKNKSAITLSNYLPTRTITRFIITTHARVVQVSFRVVQEQIYVEEGKNKRKLKSHMTTCNISMQSENHRSIIMTMDSNKKSHPINIMPTCGDSNQHHRIVLLNCANRNYDCYSSSCVSKCKRGLS